MPEEPRYPLSTVQEDRAAEEAEDGIRVGFDWPNEQVTLTTPRESAFAQVAEQIRLTRKVASTLRQRTAAVNSQDAESAFTSPTISRTHTEHGSDGSPNIQNLPVVSFHDNNGPLAKATPDGVGGWSVKVARIVSLGMAERTQVATAIKSIAAALVIAGESLKQSGNPSGNAVKTAGNVTMSLTQLLDMVNYGTSARETAKKDGLRAGIPDMRKTTLQGIGMGAVIAAAIYQGGENPIANAAAMGISTLAAMSATGPSRVEEAASKKDHEEHFFGNPAALESREYLPALGGPQSQSTVSMVTASRTGTLGIASPNNSAPASIRSIPGGMQSMLPPTRTHTSQSVDASATTSATPAAHNASINKGKKRM
ncbi:hypothetical protein [Streptomyces sp. RP5T]|uniref:hypothetical protein n=1 Tax=Streptomyces sp. RP5T TaxID=2490848 RepID=UPI000F64F699|nr:hypothetical protein [Streptomyces sp. RP5T]RRR79261.1 hypothetical protein EHS43_24385 [Streptomyces sp. RP5T]